MAGRRLETRTDWILPPPTPAIKSLVLLDESRLADHISVENDGELSRRVLCHEKALFFEFGASASRYHRASAGAASERLQLHQAWTLKCRFPRTPNGLLWPGFDDREASFQLFERLLWMTPSDTVCQIRC